MKTPPIVPSAEWDTAWQEMLVKEKELMRARDALAAQRRRMPWMAVDKNYTFEGPQGPATLLDLFDGRRQLIVYRAFIEPGTGEGDVPGLPGWPEHGCVGCSLMADHVPNLAHLNARDTTLYTSRGQHNPTCSR
nr:CalU12 protein [Mycolicibacterium malmesburyense]